MNEIETMNGLKRTHYCGTLTKDNVGDTVTVCGFVQKLRDKGNLVFVDLRDRTGIIQLQLNETSNPQVLEKAKSVRAEYVVMATGNVKIRESINNLIPTGEIEIYVTEFKILSAAQTPPFHILDEINVKEELRLKYRYLDLRRPQMQNTLITRHKIVKAARDYFDENGFIEIETPMLIKSTPEGARDYLVPSRIHKGCFYALPQSPQLYKQLLMLSGFDRYMQITRCFRDEDLRADRQPEFTQIDLEMSFVDQEDVIKINEGFMKYVFKRVLDITVEDKFIRLTYDEAMRRYGSDKPDTRFDMEITDLSELLKDTTFNVFSGAILDGGSVRAIVVKNSAYNLPRKKIDALTPFVKTYKAKGLAYTKLMSDSKTSSFEKFLSEDEVANIHTTLGTEENDVVFIVADSDNEIVLTALGELRCHLAKELGLIDENKFNFLWVTNFPSFEFDEENNRYVAKHHPFTAVNDTDKIKLKENPKECYSKAYDLVLNGSEVGGGSIRISDPEMQEDMFTALGFSKEQAEERFGFLLEALKYGTPPHGGLAFGLDRLVMLMTKKDNIRDVIAFPKVQNAGELMSNCPSEVDEKQLGELALLVNK